MSRFVDTPPAEMHAVFRATEGTGVDAFLLFDIAKEPYSVVFSKRFLDAQGIEIEKAYTLKNCLRFLVKEEDSRLLCLLDYLPDGEQQSVRRQRNDELI